MATPSFVSLAIATRGDGYSLGIDQLRDWHAARTGQLLTRAQLCAELTPAWRAGDALITRSARLTVRRGW
jgi:hypothetical protein